MGLNPPPKYVMKIDDPWAPTLMSSISIMHLGRGFTPYMHPHIITKLPPYSTI
jgi:hypothetical protein